METEADEFGLKLAAKACFDVREAPVFLGNGVLKELALFGSTPPEFLFKLSTHPSRGSRELNLINCVRN